MCYDGCMETTGQGKRLAKAKEDEMMKAMWPDLRHASHFGRPRYANIEELRPLAKRLLKIARRDG